MLGQVLEITILTEERFILTHSFRGFSPQSPGPAALGLPLTKPHLVNVPPHPSNAVAGKHDPWPFGDICDLNYSTWIILEQANIEEESDFRKVVGCVKTEVK